MRLGLGLGLCGKRFSRKEIATPPNDKVLTINNKVININGKTITI